MRVAFWIFLFIAVASASAFFRIDMEEYFCDGCGSSVDEPGLCADCLLEIEDENDGFCTYCSGTGEGMVDGSRCHYCGGRGYKRPATEFDEPDEDYREYR